MNNFVEMQVNSKSELDALINDSKPVILYFCSETCNVCHSVLPKLISIIEDLPVSFIKVKADIQPEICGQLLVFTVPTILIFYEGKEILRESRFIDFNNIEKMLNRVIETKNNVRSRY